MTTTAVEVSVREKAIAAHVEAVRVADENTTKREAEERASCRAAFRKECAKILGVDLSDDAMDFRDDGLPETTAIDGLRIGLFKDEYDYWPRLSVGLTCSREGCRCPEAMVWRNITSLADLGGLIVGERPHHSFDCTVEYDADGDPIGRTRKVVSEPPSVEQRLGDVVRDIVREEISNSQG